MLGRRNTLAGSIRPGALRRALGPLAGWVGTEKGGAREQSNRRQRTVVRTGPREPRADPQCRARRPRRCGQIHPLRAPGRGARAGSTAPRGRAPTLRGRRGCRRRERRADGQPHRHPRIPRLRRRAARGVARRRRGHLRHLRRGRHRRRDRPAVAGVRIRRYAAHHRREQAGHAAVGLRRHHRHLPSGLRRRPAGLPAGPRRRQDGHRVDGAHQPVRRRRHGQPPRSLRGRSRRH